MSIKCDWKPWTRKKFSTHVVRPVVVVTNYPVPSKYVVGPTITLAGVRIAILITPRCRTTPRI